MIEKIKKECFEIIQNAVQEAGVPPCFGNDIAPNFYFSAQSFRAQFDLYDKEQREKWHSERLEDAKKHAEQKIKCAYCKFFDRCFMKNLLDSMYSIYDAISRIQS